MMKQCTRSLAILLALAMLLSVSGLSALAAAPAMDDAEEELPIVEDAAQLPDDEIEEDAAQLPDDEGVARIGDTYYSTLQAAVNDAQDGDTVTLVADETTNTVIMVSKSITIEGDDHAVNSTASRILRIDTNDVTVTLNNIEFKSDVAERGVQVDVGITGVELNINNCTVPGTYYAINMCNYTNVTINIDHSTIRGWGALNLWGNDYKVTVTNSTLIGHNDKNYNAAGWNGFGVVVLEGDTTGQTDDHVSGCHVVLDNCHIIASTAVNAAGNANTQKVILFNNPSASNTVEITGDKTIVEYEQGDLTPFCSNNGNKNTLIITGGTFSGDVNKYCAPDYNVMETEDGNWVAVEKDYVARIGETRYETIPAALAAAQTGDTVEIIKAGEYAPITIPAGVTVQPAEDVDVVFKNTGSAQMLLAAGATLKDVTVDNTGNNAANWTKATAVGYVKGNGFTLDGCTILGADASKGVAILHCNDQELTIKNCVIKDFKRGYYACGDNNALGIVNITDNTFENVDIPVDGYWGKPVVDGKMTVTGNTFDDGSFIQLWDYTQYQAWNKNNTESVQSAVNAQVTGNTGDVTIVATHCDWFVPTTIVTDEDANVLPTRLVVVEGVPEGATVKAIPADGELAGFEDHTTASLNKNTGKLNFYYLPDGNYKVEVVSAEGETLTDLTMYATVKAPVEGANKTLTLRPDDEELHEHAWDEGEQTKAPTCAVKGETTYTCWCGETKTEADIDAKGHNAEGSVEHKDATCTQPGVVGGTYCTACDNGKEAAEAEIEAKGHNAEGNVEHKDATCTETGVVGGTYCTACDNGKEAAEAEIEATGHTVVTDAAVAATCTETGLTEGNHCSVCDAVLVAQETVAAAGHTVVADVAVAATCTETGLTEGSHCSVCDTVLVAQETVAAAGHTVVVDEAVAATYTETGLTEGSHCSVCGAVLVAQTEVATLTRPSSGGSSRPSGTASRPVTVPDEELEDPDVPLADKPFLFEDVAQNDWYYDVVKFAFDNDLMKGVTETRFAPTLETDRAMIVTMLYRMEKEPQTTGESFPDVVNGQWYTDAVIWSVATDIAKGYGNGNFGPQDKVTREQLALFLLRYAQVKGYDVTGRDALDSFTDRDSVSDWALEATQWAVGAGLMKGDNGKLRPQDTASRAETAALFVRFIQAYAPQADAE